MAVGKVWDLRLDTWCHYSWGIWLCSTGLVPRLEYKTVDAVHHHRLCPHLDCTSIFKHRHSQDDFAGLREEGQRHSPAAIKETSGK